MKNKVIVLKKEDKYNKNKVWIIKKYSNSTFYFKQVICGVDGGKFVRTNKKHLFDVGLLF